MLWWVPFFHTDKDHTPCVFILPFSVKVGILLISFFKPCLDHPLSVCVTHRETITSIHRTHRLLFSLSLQSPCHVFHMHHTLDRTWFTLRILLFWNTEYTVCLNTRQSILTLASTLSFITIHWSTLAIFPLIWGERRKKKVRYLIVGDETHWMTV